MPSNTNIPASSNCHPVVYTRVSRPHYAACSHLPAANECVYLLRTARLLLKSTVVGRSGLQVWRRSCQTDFKAGAPDGVCICAFIHSVIQSFSHPRVIFVLEPFDNMRSNLNGSRTGRGLSKPSSSGDARLASNNGPRVEKRKPGQRRVAVSAWLKTGRRCRLQSRGWQHRSLTVASRSKRLESLEPEYSRWPMPGAALLGAMPNRRLMTQREVEKLMAAQTGAGPTCFNRIGQVEPPLFLLLYRFAEP